MFSGRKIFRAANFIFLVALTSKGVIAQGDNGIKTSQDAVYGGEGIDVLYTHTSDINVFAHSQGAGISFRYGKFSTASNSRSLNSELMYIRHEREEKSANPVHLDGLPYVYGKVNSFINLRLAMEHRWEITPKLRQSGVQINHLVRYGASVAMLKPVYLEIGYPELPYEYVITEVYDPNEHFYDDIYGRASWVNGLDQTKFTSGAHICYALNFEYSEVRGSTSSIEVGGVLDVYMSEIEIMASELMVEPQRLFATVYLKLGIGANWTQSK